MEQRYEEHDTFSCCVLSAPPPLVLMVKRIVLNCASYMLAPVGSVDESADLVARRYWER